MSDCEAETRNKQALYLLENEWGCGRIDVGQLQRVLRGTEPDTCCKAEPVTEWGAAHVDGGMMFNTHHTRESAQSFVDGMNDVGANMMVVSREYTPAVYGEWRKP